MVRAWAFWPICWHQSDQPCWLDLGALARKGDIKKQVVIYVLFIFLDLFGSFWLCIILLLDNCKPMICYDIIFLVIVLIGFAI